MSRLVAPVISPGNRRPVAARALTPRDAGRVWALASGSGGVGRTTLTAALGARLVRAGHRVCLVDADWTGPSLAGLLGLHGAGPSSWLDAAPLHTPEHPELQVLSGPAPLAGDPSKRSCRALVERVTQLDSERIVLDLPAGSSDAALELWLAADRPVLVAVPERLPLESAARLLARVFARRVQPWLTRQLGADAARAALERAWQACEGRPASWLRATAVEAGVFASELVERAGSKPLYLVLNRVRRGDDVDVGHALVSAARDGLGLDLRFRGVVPFEDDGWIRARRHRVAVPGTAAGLLGLEVDDLLRRMERDEDVPPPGTWQWSLQDAAAAMKTGTGK